MSKKIKVSITMEKSRVENIDEKAKQERRSRNFMINDMIDRFFQLGCNTPQFKKNQEIAK